MTSRFHILYTLIKNKNGSKVFKLPLEKHSRKKFNPN